VVARVFQDGGEAGTTTKRSDHRYGVGISGSDTICMEVSSGSVILYGTATDNTTNDPSMQLATPVSARCQSP
jgi:hypothetical protein